VNSTLSTAGIGGTAVSAKARGADDSIPTLSENSIRRIRISPLDPGPRRIQTDSRKPVASFVMAFDFVLDLFSANA
jgi:hypothetical protein